MKKVISIIAFALIFTVASAQDSNNMGYKRSSLYPILLTHPTELYSLDIQTEYEEIEIPDKFDNHVLSVRYVSAEKRRTDESVITEFIDKNEIGRRMVARWFNRNKETGLFNMKLVFERGKYNASAMDVDAAHGTVMGASLIEDAGQDLIENSFVLVHDISYIDKEKGARIASAILQGLAGMAGVVASSTSGDTKSYADLAGSVANLGASISDKIAGFTVKTTSHLYQLEWNDETASRFYELFWCDENTPADSVKVRKERFEKCDGFFKMKYVGSYVARSQKTVLRGLHNSDDVIRKVCARALDKNIAMLQKEFEVFRVKTPILSVDGNNLLVGIGMKEEVDNFSKFEVLEAQMGEDGRTSYKRVGTIKPVNNKIWDNRYMAREEEAEGATLPGTTFEVVSGSGFYPGMLVREIK